MIETPTLVLDFGSPPEIEAPELAPVAEPDEAAEHHAARVRDYENRRAARIERYQDRAANAAQRSASAFNRADDATRHIPMGQPILVGHHSEGHHRAALKRSDNAMRTGIEESNKAQYWADRVASAARNRAIFSDDPDAAEKLSDKIARLEARQERMKDINSRVRKAKITGKTDPELYTKLDSVLDEAERDALLNAIRHDWRDAVAFPGYMMTNNGANIRRLKERLVSIEKAASEETTSRELGAVTITDNTEANRLQIEFPGKPSDVVRGYLKAHGFRWNRTDGVWQRHRSNGAQYHAEQAAKLHNGETAPTVADTALLSGQERLEAALLEGWK